MSKRKEIYKKLVSKGKDIISKAPNISKQTSDNETEEEDIRDKLDGEVPEEFRKEMNKFSKEELIEELFFLRHEYFQTKRELELTTFKLTQMQSGEDESDELDIDLDTLRKLG